MDIHYRFSPENNNHFYFLSILIILLLLFSPFAKAQTYPSGFTQSAITKKLKRPTTMPQCPTTILDGLLQKE
ncbi:MAG TPA: hypothetical protein VNW06_10975 [Cytophagaceae bacterium]|jgi:hypothetical protein|nr:hypothetical protein [Cytophagaceae bacterium]